MNEQDPLKNISKAILDFSNTKELVGLEKYVLNNLRDPNEAKLFKDIWATTINFDNWNHSSLQVGFDKTMEILKHKYNLNEKICRFLANRAAYEWK